MKDLLKRFGIDDSKTKSTQMNTITKLDKDEKGNEVDIKMYRGMIDSLLYLTASRPDIIFSVCLYKISIMSQGISFSCCKKKFSLFEWNHRCLWYPRGTHIDLTCYSDADIVGYKVDRKSTSRTCHFLGH